LRGLLPRRPIAEKLVEHYFNTFERTHRLFHYPTFQEQLASFWEDGDLFGDDWLAQLFSLLALGCHAWEPDPYHTEYDGTNIVNTCLDAAANALQHVNYMAKPSLEIMRAMCMMVVAKEAMPSVFGDSDDLWTLMGLVVRAAMMAGLHRDPKWFPSMPLLQTEQRKRIWNTILLLSVESAIESGMPLPILATHFDTTAPMNVDDVDLLLHDCDLVSHSVDTYTDSSLQIHLAAAYPSVLAAVEPMNTLGEEMDIEKASEYDRAIRKVLSDASRVFESPAIPDGSTQKSIAMTQGLLISTFLRRVLLALHQPHVKRSRNETSNSISHYTMLESSIALTTTYRHLHEIPSDPACQASATWFADYFRQTFAIATGYLALGLRCNAFSESAEMIPGKSPRHLAWEHLLAARDILLATSARSSHHLKLATAYVLIIGAMEAIETKTPILPAMTAAAERVIEHVQHNDLVSQRKVSSVPALSGAEACSSWTGPSRCSSMLELTPEQLLSHDPSLGLGYDPVAFSVSSPNNG